MQNYYIELENPEARYYLIFQSDFQKTSLAKSIPV